MSSCTARDNVPQRLGTQDLRNQSAKFGHHVLLLLIHDRRVQPLQQRPVRFHQEPQRLPQIPPAEIELVFVDREINRIVPLKHAEIPITRMHVKEPHIIVTIIRSESPCATAGFARVENANPVLRFDLVHFRDDLVLCVHAVEFDLILRAGYAVCRKESARLTLSGDPLRFATRNSP